MNILEACRTFPLPAKSPDLSPVEHIWNVMKIQLQLFWIVADLTCQLERIRQEIPQNTILEFYQSMPRGVSTCIQARDRPTLY